MVVLVAAFPGEDMFGDDPYEGVEVMKGGSGLMKPVGASGEFTLERVED